MLDAPYPPSTYCMRSSDLVELIDDTGRATGAKPRSQIDKTRDVYHGVYVLLMTPARELVLSEIPERSDLLNLYVHKLGVTAATMRRVGETPELAAQRAIASELRIQTTALRHLGDGFEVLRDGRRTYMSGFLAVGAVPHQYSTLDIDRLAVLSLTAVAERFKQDVEQFAPTFEAFWHNYQSVF